MRPDVAAGRGPARCLEGEARAVHRLGAEDVTFPLPGPSLVPPSPPVLGRARRGPVSVHGNASLVSARGNWSKVHCAGALSGRQRTSLVPWRKRLARDVVVTHLHHQIWPQRLPFRRPRRAPAARSSGSVAGEPRRVDQLFQTGGEFGLLTISDA